MSYVNINGVELFYEFKAGQGGSLVFIHGSGGRHEQWAGQMQLRYNCAALDLPGHGQSGGNALSEISAYSAWVADFLNAVALPRPLYLVGFSMGSAISLQLALDQPESADGLILLGAGQRMKVLPTFLEELRQNQADLDFIRLGFSSQAPEETVAQMVVDFAAAGPAILYADFSACNDFDVTGKLEGIKLPTLLITGAEDRLTPLKLSQYVAEHIPGARLEVVPGAGHFAMLEQPDQVNRLIEEFCS